MKTATYKATVKSVSDRNITVTASHLEQCDLLVKPLFDGAIKTAVPSVGDLVWIIDPFSTGTYRRYIPVDLDFTNLSDSPDDTQIEAPNGDVWVSGDIIYLGASASEWVAMANLVNTELDRIKTDFETLKTLLVTHTHEQIPGSGIYTATDLVALPGFTPTTPSDVSSKKTKSE